VKVQTNPWNPYLSPLKDSVNLTEKWTLKKNRKILVLTPFFKVSFLFINLLFVAFVLSPFTP